MNIKYTHIKRGKFTMTKKEAGQLYHLNREAEMWQKALAAERSKSLIQGQQLTGMPTGGMMCPDKTANKAIKELEIENEIKDLESKIVGEKTKIIRYIRSLDNSIDRQIVWLRAACFLQWKVIADKIGGNNTEDSVRMRYNRIFK